MKIEILKSYKKLQPKQELNVNDEYAKGLIKKGVAKESGTTEATGKEAKK